MIKLDEILQLDGVLALPPPPPPPNANFLHKTFITPNLTAFKSGEFLSHISAIRFSLSTDTFKTAAAAVAFLVGGSSETSAAAAAWGRGAAAAAAD